MAGGTSESTQTLRVYNTSPGYCVSEIKGTGVTLQNTSTSPINVLMTLEINPAGSGATLCDSSEDITVAESISWTGNSGIIYYLVAFFLLATVLRLPFLVRELFLVCCPLKGRPDLCRIPL